METFKATPTFIEWKRSWDNVKYGNTVHTFNMTVERENGMIDDGIFTTLSENQTKFKIGELAEIKTSSVTEDHELTTKFDKVSQHDAGSGGSGKGGYSGKNDPVKQRAIAANVSIECANRIILNMEQGDAVKADLSALKTMADKIYKYIMEKAQGDTQQSITIQAQTKIVTNYFHAYPNVPMSTSDQALKYVDDLVAWVNNKAKG